MRLDKFIATVTDLSRTDAKRAIKAGEVTVGGSVAIDAQLEVAADARVELSGRPLRAATARYFMLHKPEGCVCATKDRQHLTVLELLDVDNRESLHIAGRLDIDTTGLVLLTDDGQWSHRITAPKAHCDKTYWLQTAEPIPAETVKQFERGLFLHSEKERLKPAQLELIDAVTARLTISEGKYHQVKRMFGAIGNAVIKLHRERIGALELGALAPGEYRALTAAEIAALAA
ncbi:MAG: rRNA pseudouridine synthase [Verrucomicrobiaceae bacterium]|nr:rRNA pseudouridine synthase [Verrucomicrobiaceae bacterium]